MLTRLAVAVSPVFAWMGAAGADQVGTHGPDLQGIALIITSVSGLITTIGALVIALRRKQPSTSEQLEQLAEILRKQAPGPDEP